MRFHLTALVLVALAFSAPAEAQQVNVAPIITQDTAVILVGTSPKRISKLLSEQLGGTEASWAAKGQSGFKVGTLATTRLCVGGPDVTTAIVVTGDGGCIATDAGPSCTLVSSGRCWPVCDSSTCMEKVHGERGTISATYLVATTPIVVFVFFGSTTSVRGGQ